MPNWHDVFSNFTYTKRQRAIWDATRSHLDTQEGAIATRTLVQAILGPCADPVSAEDFAFKLANALMKLAPYAPQYASRGEPVTTGRIANTGRTIRPWIWANPMVRALADANGMDIAIPDDNDDDDEPMPQSEKDLYALIRKSLAAYRAAKEQGYKKSHKEFCNEHEEFNDVNTKA